MTTPSPLSPTHPASGPYIGLRKTMRKHPGWLTGLVVALLVASAAAVYYWPWQTEPARDKAAYHWQQAQEALAAQDYFRTRTHLEQCLELCPLDAEAHFLLARACRQTDDVAGWQTHLERAAILQWPREQTQFESALMKAQSGDARGVKPVLLGYLEAGHPEEVLIIEALVKGALETFRLQDVYSWTADWMERYPSDPRPWVYRGRAAYLGRSPSRAIADFEHALELNPDQAEAHLQLAEVRMVQRHFREALPHFQAYLGSRPQDPTALVGAANCSFSLGQMEQARSVLEVLFASHKADAGAYLVRAKLDLAGDAPLEALRQLKQAEALAPHEIDITYTLATVLAKLGQHSEAQQYERQLKDLSRQLDRLENIRKQIKKEPDNTALRHEAGAIALRMGQEKEAGRWFMSVLQIDPNHAPTHQMLADYYQKAGDTERADYHRHRATGNQPEAAKAP